MADWKGSDLVAVEADRGDGKIFRAEWRSRPVDRLELAAVRARLALPASAYSGYASRFSLRN